MSSTIPESAPDLDRHILFLGRIYTFLGWLGLAGSALLLFPLLSPETLPANDAQRGLFGLPQALSVFILVCWSILLLNFSKDLTGRRRWSTGIGGFCIGILNLLSVPIGTAVGTYTLWILFRHRRLH
jgi:hypothetical protein